MIEFACNKHSKFLYFDKAYFFKIFLRIIVGEINGKKVKPTKTHPKPLANKQTMQQGPVGVIGYIKAKWYFAFIIFSLGAFIYGLFGFFYERTYRIPFFSISVAESGENQLVTRAYIIGQFSTRGEGIFVGKQVDVVMSLYLRDNQEYEQIKDFIQEPGVIPVDNSVDVNDYNKDIKESIQRGNLTAAFVNPGLLQLTNADDNKKIITLEGSIVFTKQGEITLSGMPLTPILDKYNLNIETIDVEPYTMKYQIDLNRRVELLTFITISAGFLAIFLALSRKNVNNSTATEDSLKT